MSDMPITASGPAPSMGWREERRRDRLAAAQIGREDEQARARARAAEAESSARLQREKRQARAADRRVARKQHAARRADLAAWLRAHVVDLLFVPVIAVPSALAWTAMAAYGSQVFGPAGIALPAFSEGAMWAFAAATTISLHRDPTGPVWHLRLGTAVFAAAGAVLNFLHGLSAAPGAFRGPVAGVVMALVSVAGVVAHQIVTAGPRRSRAERDVARARRSAARRERAICRAVRRSSVAEVDAAGNARLVYQPGAVTMERRWHGGVRLNDAPPFNDAPPQVFPWPGPVPVFDAPTVAPSAPSEPQVSAIADAPVRHGTRATTRAKEHASSAPSRATGARQKPTSPQASKRAKAEKLLRANPGMSRAEVVRLSGVSERTADRIRADLPRRLHVAEG